MLSLGIDEVGRGSLAGPLVIGAVVLDKAITGLKDSKLLSPTKRQAFAKLINQQALATSLGWVSHTEIDKLGLSGAMHLGIKRALEQINHAYDEIIIDGQVNYLSSNTKARALIKADQLVPAVSAASIIAKVARANYMRQMSKKYPRYGFEDHVGYGTAKHFQMLSQLGVSDLHRRSFAPIKTLLVN